MSTPAHLEPIPLPMVLYLSGEVNKVGDMMQAVRTENLSFTISQTPHDASRTAKALQFLIEQATVALTAFEKASQNRT